MARIIGLDIGGANTKAVLVLTQNHKVVEFKMILKHFPFWKRNSEDLCNLLVNIKQQLTGKEALTCVAVTMTAELSDIYSTKREGVNYILDCVSSVFTRTKIVVLDVNLSLLTVTEAKANPLSVAAANWAATGWMVAQRFSDCIVIDVGSTSTSIIPIVAGKVSALGRTDLDKLMTGELVYTGSLRTNLAAIVQEVPVKGGTANVSSEFFVQSGDIHTLLNHIEVEDYFVETPDRKGKSRGEAFTRLAHLLCADIEMLSETELLKIANFIYEKQVDQIARSIIKVINKQRQLSIESTMAVVTGLGHDFLAGKAAQKAGIAKVIDLEEFYPKDFVTASPAAGLALMATKEIEGKLDWTL